MKSCHQRSRGRVCISSPWALHFHSGDVRSIGFQPPLPRPSCLLRRLSAPPQESEAAACFNDDSFINRVLMFLCKSFLNWLMVLLVIQVQVPFVFCLLASLNLCGYSCYWSYDHFRSFQAWIESENFNESLIDQYGGAFMFLL